MKRLEVYGPFISRKQAKEQGLKLFFTGKPCSKGHISKQYVNGYACFECTGKGSKKYARKLELMREANAKKLALEKKNFYQSYQMIFVKKL